MKFSKVGETRHGPVWSVTEGGVKLGTIQKWSVLFTALDIDGNHVLPACMTRAEAAAMLLERAQFEGMV